MVYNQISKNGLHKIGSGLDKLKKLNFTRQFIIESLDKIQYLEYQCEGKTKTIVPQNLLPHKQQILDQLELKLR